MTCVRAQTNNRPEEPYRANGRTVGRTIPLPKEAGILHTYQCAKAALIVDRESLKRQHPRTQ